MARYLDPKNDLIFYHLFGNHKHLTISYLNALMPLETGRIVETAEFIQWTQVPLHPGCFETIFNLKCSDNLSNQFVVAMQVQWVTPFRNHIVFSNGKAYAGNLEYKTDISQPVYSLAILNEIFDYQTDRFYHHYPVVYREDNGEAIPGYEIVMIELPKFKPENANAKQRLWLRFLNEMDEKIKELPPEILENEYIRQAAELCEEWRFTEAQINGYEHYWDCISTLRTIFIHEGCTGNRRFGGCCPPAQAGVTRQGGRLSSARAGGQHPHCLAG